MIEHRERRGHREARERRRVVARIEVPDRLVRMTAFGLWNFDDESRACRRWWTRVCNEMDALVGAALPRAAQRVRMQLDAERMEIVLGYELPA